jgi:hypothetical protein
MSVPKYLGLGVEETFEEELTNTNIDILVVFLGFSEDFVFL